jgi:hypothetical protein
VECGHLHHHGRTVALTHGELPLHPNYGYPRCCDTAAAGHGDGGRAELPDELVAKVLAKLLQEGGFGFTQASATVRLVSAGWKAVHDALVTRLVLRGQTTDEAVGILVRQFPAVASLEYKNGGGRVLTDNGRSTGHHCYRLFCSRGQREAHRLPHHRADGPHAVSSRSKPSP